RLGRSTSGGIMTFHQPNWQVRGDVYNVGHDLVLTKTSTAEDVLRVIDAIRSDIANESQIPEPQKAEALNAIEDVKLAIADEQPSRATVVSKLTTLKAILAGLGGT